MRTFSGADSGIRVFNVDEKIKKNIKRAAIKKQKRHKFLLFTKNVTLIMTFCIPVLFLIYAYWISDGFVQLNDFYAPIGTKNHLFIWTCTITAFVILLFLYVVIRIIYNGLSGMPINERYDESLVLENGTLSYGYKLKMQSYADERVVVKIPLNTVRYSTDMQNKKITFEGKMFSQFYTNYQNGEINGKGDYIPGIVLYDYFEPSLISFLTKQKQ